MTSTYRMKTGRSNSHWWLLCATVAGVGNRPASRRAGSGIAVKIRKVRMEIANSTPIIDNPRRTTKRPISTPSGPSVLDPDLRSRVERVAHAVAEHVDAKHAQDEHDPRHQHRVDGGGQQPDPAPHHPPPRRVRRAPPGTQERQARL